MPNHTHKLEKTNIGKKGNKPTYVWKCKGSACSSYLWEYQLEKTFRSVCWICNEPKVTLKKARPVCQECHDKRYGTEISLGRDTGTNRSDSNSGMAVPKALGSNVETNKTVEDFLERIFK